jgi:ribosomal protein L16 Arg81 hydroxylase
MGLVILFEIVIILFLIGMLYYFSQFAIVQFNANNKNEKFQRDFCELIDNNYKKLEDILKSNEEFENKIFKMLEENTILTKTSLKGKKKVEKTEK